MNRIDRLTAILIQLQTKSWITSHEIAERFDISQRTVYRDIRALEEAGIPIGAEAGKGYYLVEGYRLPPVMFTREEAGAMLIADKLVKKFADISVRKEFASATDKIKAVLPEREKEVFENLDEQVKVLYKTVESKEYPNEFITSIQRALVNKKCLKLNYHAFYSQEKTHDRIIDPLGLVFYGNTWHLIAFCKLRQDMRDFRLDRINKLQLVDEPGCVKKPKDLSRYFEEYWERSELLEAKVWIDSSIVSALSTNKYYFGFIDEYPENNGLVMSFAVTDFFIIARWLLSFEDKIKVISPPELYDEMVRVVKELNKIYLPQNILT